MPFQHILAADITWQEGEHLDRARRTDYDVLTSEQLASLIVDRQIDVWRWDGGSPYVMCTNFEEDLHGRDLAICFAGGKLQPGEQKIIAGEIAALARKLGCRRAIFTTTRPALARHIGAVEIARVYEIPAGD